MQNELCADSCLLKSESDYRNVSVPGVTKLLCRSFLIQPKTKMGTLMPEKQTHYRIQSPRNNLNQGKNYCMNIL